MEQTNTPIYVQQSVRESHGAIVERIRKTFYYGKNKGAKEVMECPSLPLTEVTVELFEKTFKKRSQSSRKQLHKVQKSPRKAKIGNDDLKTVASDLVKGLEILDMTYASSVSRSASISPCSMVLALIYMERLKQQNPEYLLSASSCDLFLVSMMVASKYLYDDGEDEEVFNDDWAISGELELLKLNKLELEFLSAIDWRLHVNPAEFFKKLELIETLVAWKETSKRRSDGQYTYHDLVCLESMLDWRTVSENFVKIIAVTCLTYSAILVSLFGLSLLTRQLHCDPNPVSMTYSDLNFSSHQTYQQVIHHESSFEASCHSAYPTIASKFTDRPITKSTKENLLSLQAKFSRAKVFQRAVGGNHSPPLVVTNS